MLMLTDTDQDTRKCYNSMQMASLSANTMLVPILICRCMMRDSTLIFMSIGRQV
jgi:hypothetical protein